MKQLEKIAETLGALAFRWFICVFVCGSMLASPVSASQQQPAEQSPPKKSENAKYCVEKPSYAVSLCYKDTAIVVRSVGPSAKIYYPGLKVQSNTKITLKKFDKVTILTKNGTKLFTGPGTFTPVGVNISAQAAVIGNRRSSRARTGAVRYSQYRPASKPASAGIPVYPVWPPETPSSRVGLDRFISARENTSLYGAGEKLKRAFEDAGYLEHSYYAVPGGFVLVTRIEKISATGDALTGQERYRLPNQPRKSSLTDTIRGMFLDAPPGYYRYIAVVVSDKPFGTSRRRLRDTEAIRRLQRGSNNLSAQYKATKFTSDFKVEALIYEFRKNTQTGRVRMIAPGRLAPNTHLAKTRLNRTVTARFRR